MQIMQRGGNAADAAIGIVAEIDRIVIARPEIADERRTDRKTIVVDFRLVAFPIDIPGDAQLARQANHREILTVDVGVEDPVIPRPLKYVVQPRVCVLLEPPNRREIELDPIVVAIPEEPKAQLLVLEKEAAKIEIERLDAESQAVEVVAVARVAEVIVEEGFLNTEGIVETIAADARTNIEHPAFRTPAPA